ncbi:MAG: efflux RND transporter periplasmic adaptor subunit [Bacteroidales bacterium]|nr:efflux RND transporter periplasmic adaptor subunit [Bacteroidales bacterium]
MRRSTAILLGLLSLLVLSSCRQARLRHIKVQGGEVYVAVDTVHSVADKSRNSYVGIVESSREAVILANNGGIVKEIYVKEGSDVHASDVLALVESKNISSAYEVAMATLRRAEDGYSRASKVFAGGSVSQVKMVELQTQLEQARAAADAARHNLEECSIRAPFDGRVNDVQVQRGVHVAALQPLFTLVDTDGMEIVISVPEKEINSVNTGDRALVLFPSQDREIPATVKSKSVVADPLSHSYRCTLSIAADASLLPGMVCKLTLCNESGAGIVLRADAVKLDGEGKYVWVVENGDTVRKRRIATSGFRAKGVIVSEGLSDGDLVIVEGASKVSTGMKVKIKR